MASQSVCSDLGELFFYLFRAPDENHCPPPIPSPPCVSFLIVIPPQLPHSVHHSPSTLTTSSRCQTSQQQYFVLYFSWYIQNRKMAEVPGWSIFYPFLYRNRSAPISFSHRGQGEPRPQLCCFTRTKGSIRGPSSAGGFLKHCITFGQCHSYTEQKDGLRSCTNHNLDLD